MKRLLIITFMSFGASLYEADKEVEILISSGIDIDKLKPTDILFPQTLSVRTKSGATLKKI